MVGAIVSYLQPKSDNGITVIDFKSYAQFFAPTMEIHEIGRTIRIAYKGQSQLYISALIKETLDIVQNGTITDTVLTSDTSYIVHTWHNNDTIGFKYTLDNYRNEKGKIVSVNSMLNHFGIDSKHLAVFDAEYETKEASIKHYGRKMTETLVFKKTHVTQPDTIYRFYDEDLKNINFTFSKKLDTKRNSKFYKELFVFNKVGKEQSMVGQDIPRRIMYNEFQIVTDFNLKQLEEIFEKAAGERKALNLK